MENGALGEAMCSALLLQRFWVRKRSIDADAMQNQHKNKGID